MTIGIVFLFLHLSVATATEIVKPFIAEEKTLMKARELSEKLEEGIFSNKILSYTRRFPIRIEGNDNFTAENGVVAGNGTKENPYIIEGWEIKGNEIWKKLSRIFRRLDWPTDFIPSYGIYLAHTDKYVIIRNNYLHDWRNKFLDIYFSGIRIMGASNVTIEYNIIEKNTIGIYMANIQQPHDYASTNIIIRFNDFEDNNDAAIRAYNTYNSSIVYNNFSGKGGTGIDSFYSTLYIAHNTIFDCGNGIICSDEDHSLIENNLIVGNGNGIYCAGGHQIISNNTLQQNLDGIFITSGHPIISNNTIVDNKWYGIMNTGGNRYDLTIIVDNIISNTSGDGINYYGPVIIEHNLITSNEEGIFIHGNASIQYNIFSHNKFNGIICTPLYGEYPYVHYNNIFDNGGKGIKYVETICNDTLNATYNYWGAANGPSGYGNGSGDKVDKNIIFEPWLTEPYPYAGPR